MIEPAILHGAVTHRRTRPRGHAFTYRAFMLRPPLSRHDDLPALGLPLARRGLVSFDPADHGPPDGAPALAWIRGLLREHGVAGFATATTDVGQYVFVRER